MRQPTIHAAVHPRIRELAAVFMGVFLFLFLSMNRSVNLYDEGLTLTGAMRVFAGQVPYRDFYYIYGPAELYLLSSVFKLFGQSVLAARLVDVFIESLLACTVYAAINRECGARAAISTTVISLLWVFSLDMHSAAVIPVSLLILLVTVLILSIIERGGAPRRTLLAGLLAGVTGLFRPDAGFALLVIQVVVIWLADTFLEEKSRLGARKRAFLAGQFSAGFFLPIVPPLLIYLRAAGTADIRFDLFYFPLHYYRAARSLPFPDFGLASMDNWALLVPVIVVVVAMIALLRYLARDRASSHSHEIPKSMLFLFSFSLLTSAMFVKGMIRTSVTHAYLALLPSIVMLAVLFSHRGDYGRWNRAVIVATMWISCLAVFWASLIYGLSLYAHKNSVIDFLVSRTSLSAVVQNWCTESSPLTKGVCFVPDVDHILLIEFLRDHTGSADSIYVGLPRHDRVFINDNMTYFAAQRLPATKWSHFDPDLQSSLAIQEKMIEDLSKAEPPYVVLDSEFDESHEPNDSSRSSGVFELDRFVQHRYRPLTSFGKLAVWERSNGDDGARGQPAVLQVK